MSEAEETAKIRGVLKLHIFAPDKHSMHDAASLCLHESTFKLLYLTPIQHSLVLEPNIFVHSPDNTVVKQAVIYHTAQQGFLTWLKVSVQWLLVGISMPGQDGPLG